MTKKATFYPSSIEQPNQNERNPIKKWSFNEVRRGGGVYPYGRSSPNDPRYFHRWSNVSELKKGKMAQCGRPSTYSCSHATYYGIKGYRNTCPIAGCNGTYNAPATLRLKFSESALAQKGIKNGAKISQIVVSFEHKCTGVDVADGKEYTNWGPNFYGYKEYPSLKVLKLYFTNSSGTRISSIVSKNSKGDDFQNPPLGKFGTVKAIFKDVSYNELKNGGLNIVYGRNLSTNPGNIYIRGAKIEVYYTDEIPAIDGKQNQNSLYTSTAAACRTNIIHTITVGYKQGDSWVNSSKTITKDNIKIEKPKGVAVQYIKQEGRKIQYKITDGSNQAGKKKIKYTIKNTKKSKTLVYEAKTKSKPSISISGSIKQHLNEDEASNLSLIAKGGCLTKLEIYIDDWSHPLQLISSSELDYTNSSNFLSDDIKKTVLQNISNSKCGPHTIIFRRNNESNEDAIKKKIQIIPRQYIFKMYTGQSQENVQEFNFIQNKSANETITIQRIDNELPSVPPQFLIEENTLTKFRKQNPAQPVCTINNGETKDVPISLYIPGNFYISIKEVFNDTCSITPDKRNIIITPHHIQNHDLLYVRGEDSTSFDYDYLVAWEGDNNTSIIDVDNIELMCSYDDLRICAEKISTIGLSETGVAKIRIENDSKQRIALNNIKLELNVLKENENGEIKVTTDEYFDLDGMLLNFNNNFELYNQGILNNVSIENLSPDMDLEEEENVYIHIKQLLYGDSITINIPFSCRTDKTIYLQALLFGEPMKLHPFLNCQSSETFDYIKLITYDSILTNMEINGNLDLIEPNITYNLLTGATENQCPNECFNTKNSQTTPWWDGTNINGGISYKIKNIDSSDCTSAQTIIKNDENLIPFGFIIFNKNELGRKVPTPIIINDNYNPNPDTDKVYWNTKYIGSYIKTVNAIIKVYVNFPTYDEEILMQRTDKNGNATFIIQVPEISNQEYTINKLLEEVVTIEYEGNAENQPKIIGKVNDTINQKISKQNIKKATRLAELRQLQTSVPSNSRQKTLIDKAISALENDDRNDMLLKPIDNYRKYKPGQIITLNVNLQTQIMHKENYIFFNPDILHSGDSDELIVFYKICNLENNKGILNTTFQTNDDMYTLISNKVSKDIYCGVETVLYSKVNIEKRIVEQNTLNVIHVHVFNEVRDNHDIFCLIDLGPNPDILTGTYDTINIELDDGESNIRQENGHTIIEWNIGEMKADTTSYATIILKGRDIGLSEVLIDTYDYLHNPQQSNDYHFEKYLCDCKK